MAAAEIPRNLGDYELLELLEQRGQLLFFRARQISVGRRVNLVLLHPFTSGEEDLTEFQAMVRAKAAVHQVHIAPVFEVLEFDTYHFFTRQEPRGRSLAELLESESHLAPNQIFQLLESLADAHIYLESEGIAHRPLEASQIFVTETGVSTLQNTALAGERSPDASSRDILALGQMLKPLVDAEGAGAGRAHTLLMWMRGEDRERAMSWAEVKKLCQRVDEQFTSENFSRNPSQPIKLKRKPTPYLPFIGGLLAVLVVGLALWRLSGSDGESPAQTGAPTPPPPIRVNPAEGSAFECAGAPVSISEFGEFLEAYERMSESEQMTLRHPAQPESIDSYQPDDWIQMREAAAGGYDWYGQQLQPQSPITRVSFWAAHAYANWRGGKIPTEAQWRQVFEQVKRDGDSLSKPDSIREWTSSSARKPSFPMGPKYPKVLAPKRDKAQFEFIDSRDRHEIDLGFRLIFPITDAQS